MAFPIMLHFVPPAGKEGQRPGITRQELRGGRKAIVAGARLVIEFARVTRSCQCAIPGTRYIYRKCMLERVVRFEGRVSAAAGVCKSRQVCPILFFSGIESSFNRKRSI